MVVKGNIWGSCWYSRRSWWWTKTLILSVKMSNSSIWTIPYPQSSFVWTLSWIDRIKFSTQQVREIFWASSRQANNDLWFKFRFYRITSSVIYYVYSISTDKSNQNLKSLFDKILSSNPLLNDKKEPLLIKWGCDNEKDAVNSFKKDLQQKGNKKVKLNFLP